MATTSPPPPPIVYLVPSDEGSTVYEWTAVVLMMVAVFTISVAAFCVCWRCWGVDSGGKKLGPALGEKRGGDEEDGDFHSMEGVEGGGAAEGEEAR